jgi:peptide deformylase
MAVLDILHVGHPILRQRARELPLDELASPDVQRLIDDLIETMHAANGAGIAAPQVGQPLAICVVEVRENPRYPYLPSIPLTILVNPTISPRSSDTFSNYEGCLSVPNLRGRVTRSTEIGLSYLDRTGARTEREVRGLSAGVYQHECDHLLGTLFVDRVSDPRSLTTWAEFERHHKAAFLAELVPLIERWGS